MQPTVYVVDTHDVLNKSHADLTDKEFITLSKNSNMDYTLQGFQSAFNLGEFDEPHFVIRFLNS